MFLNHSEIFSFSFKSKLQQVVKPICSIANDIGQQTIPDFNYSDLFSEAFIAKCGYRKSSLQNEKELFSIIGEFYNANIFDFDIFTAGLEVIQSSNILFLDKLEKTVFFKGDVKSLNSTLISYIKKLDIDNDLIANIDIDLIKKCLSSVSLFDNTILYNKSVSTAKSGQQKTPFIFPISILTEDKIKSELIDENRFWINRTYISDNYGIDIVDNPVFYSKSDSETGTLLGYSVDNYFIPAKSIQIEKYIKQENLSELIFSLFINVFNKKNAVIVSTSPLIEEFKKENKNSELNKLLSYLVYNLYISADNLSLINPDFEVFFEEVALVQDLNPYNSSSFFISKSDEKQLALGIYSTEKLDSNYNLLHWIEQDNENYIQHKPHLAITKQKKALIKTLRPDVAFYFIRKYYEDIIEDILHSNQFDFISNFKIDISTEQEYEVDFFIKTETKLIFMEAKTKLTQLNIEQYLVKSTNIYKVLRKFIDDSIAIEFIIVGSYSENLEKHYKHFIDLEPDTEYNNKREGLNTLPYKFAVPLQEIKGLSLLCIAEPEYDKLDKLIKEKCQ